MSRERGYRKDVEELLIQGLRNRDIAERVGCSTSYVGQRRRALKLPRSRSNDFFDLCERHGTRIGDLGGAIEAQGLEFRRWLLREVPEGSTVTEFLVACALDQMMEERADAEIPR